MLNRQGCHNSGEPIPVVPELKRFVKLTVKLHVTIKNNNGDRQTCYVKCYMTERLFSRIVFLWVVITF